MNNLEKKVLESFKWKKGPTFCAAKIGISELEYSKIKSKIKRKNFRPQPTSYYNLDKGEAKLELVTGAQPKSPEEIIKLLNIDADVWKLSSYWNKQVGDKWKISAFVTKIKENDEFKLFSDLLKNWKPKPFYINNSVKKVNNNLPKVCGIMSLQDIHFGKEGNETIDKDFEDAIIDLSDRASRSHDIKKLYFVIGGDLINMDTFTGTTTSGTPVDNSMKATDAYMQAFNSMHWAIARLIPICDELVIVYMPGNHDRLSSFHLVHALSMSIKHSKITWDIDYAERKVHVWGSNFNAFEHGDVKSKSTPLVYATEFAVEWGRSSFRTLFTGHYHQNRKVEYLTSSEEVGFVHKTLPSLCKFDYYHYHNKYVGNRRSAVFELQSFDKGTICELVYSI